MRARGWAVRCEPGRAVHGAISDQCLPRARRAGVRANGLGFLRRLTGQEVRTMKNMHMRAVTVLLLGAGALAGCSGGGGNVNIGDTSPVGAKLSAYAATWDGFAQAYRFWAYGAYRVLLSIDALGHGALRVGAWVLLAAPSDPVLFS